ncbi:hypothetical protein MAR_016001 [Mya arenaria]|uniref:SWIM-type domain-containing protein n=1 Tax=Mya arenaria TaxID=6604 RepID=A0ABY7FIR6_MYAAR|nr:hypothetical protein MAR_016001 [Mya arenaria]
MDSKKVSEYFGWSVVKLKKELITRVALRFNFTIGGTLRENLFCYPSHWTLHDWQESGFHQLQLEHRIILPKLSRPQIDGYFKYRDATDKNITSDIKALQKGQLLYNSKIIRACSISVKGENLFFAGIVSVAMIHNLKLRKENGEVLNSDCESPAGKGPHGTCKHLAAVLIMISEFVSDNNHNPKKQYSGTPLKVEDLPGNKQTNEFQDPRPPAFRNCANYTDHVRNTVFNCCSNTSKDLAIRYIWGKADIQSAGRDHDYLPRPLLKQWVDKAQHISPEQIVTI